MKMKPDTIAPGVYRLPMGVVSAYLIDDGGELSLIDSGVRGSAAGILQAVAQLGRRPEDLKHILITHLHTDHTGGAKALQEATGAKLYMHPLDAVDYRRGVTLRPRPQATSLLSRVLTAAISRKNIVDPDAAARIDGELADGETLPFAGGLKVIHTPGHTAGHVVFLWPHEGGVLFGGDACSNFTRMGKSMLYEDTREGMRSLEKIAGLKFETACLAHGRVIRGGADELFRRKW
jgi:glyoxylase-like metal-dependent hydrolase (beta-lactamase superfamily II)